MTKEEEIKILTATIKKLGNDSYLGPALAAVLPNLESDLRCDLIPDINEYRRFLYNEIEGKKAAIKELDALTQSSREKFTEAERKLARINWEIETAQKQARELADNLADKVRYLRTG